MVSQSAGSYRLSVKASSLSAPTGQYEIHVVEIRTATEKDRSMHEVRKLEAESRRALLAGRYENARQLAERALAISENVLGMEHPFPLWDPIRSDPRYKDLLKRCRLL